MSNIVALNGIANIEDTAQAVLAINIFAGVVITFFTALYAYLHFFYKAARINFHTSSLHLHKGLIIETNAYSAYTNIKDIETLKYPLTPSGNVSFNIAGEDVVKTNTGNKALMVYLFGIFGALASNAKIRKYSHELSLKYVSDIALHHIVF